MNVENKFIRLLRNSGPARFFIPLGLILIVVGVVMLVTMPKDENLVETTGKVTRVEERQEMVSEDNTTRTNTVYDVYFTYEAEGKTLEGSFIGMSKKSNVGDEVKVYYDRTNPTSTTNTKVGGFLPYIFFGVAAVAIFFGVLKTVQAFKKSKELDADRAPQVSFDGYKTKAGVQELYCRYDGKTFKPGYILEDGNRTVLYEGTMAKQALVGARTFEFKNHKTGATAEHAVGHTTTQSYNNEMLSARSWFKFDGENVWDLLHNRGFRLATNMRSKFPNLIYEVSKNGAPFALIETSGMYVHEDEAAQHSLNIPVGRYYYRIWTDSNDLDNLFLTVFAISEAEQTVVE